MDERDIESILEAYGLDRILEDNQTTLTNVVGILYELGYIDLDIYTEGN
jgi:hypothetical protein